MELSMPFFQIIFIFSLSNLSISALFFSTFSLHSFCNFSSFKKTGRYRMVVETSGAVYRSADFLIAENALAATGVPAHPVRVRDSHLRAQRDRRPVHAAVRVRLPR